MIDIQSKEPHAPAPLLLAEGTPDSNIQVTVIESPNKVVTRSCFGANVKYMRWCLFEVQRMRKKGSKAFVLTDQRTGGVAVFTS